MYSGQALNSELMDHRSPSGGAPVRTEPSQHSPLGFVLRCSGSWGADTLAPLGADPLHTEHPSGTDPACPVVTFPLMAWPGRWQALGKVFRGSVKHTGKGVLLENWLQRSEGGDRTTGRSSLEPRLHFLPTWDVQPDSPAT